VQGMWTDARTSKLLASKRIPDISSVELMRTDILVPGDF